MKTWLRRLAWLLLILLLIPLLLGLAWLASNWRDAEPRPWPAELKVAPNRLGASDNLDQVLDGHGLPEAIQLRDCGEASDCREAWRARLPKWQENLRQAPAAFLQACESLATRPVLRFEETLPARLGPSSPSANYQGLMRCQALLLLRAYLHEGPHEGRLDWLRQSDRLVRAVQQGSRTLLGQLIAAGMGAQQLTMLRELAQQHPELRPTLVPLAEPREEDWRAGLLRWTAAEAEFGRNVIEDLAKRPCAEAAAQGQGAWSGWTCSFQGRTLQPNYLVQQSARQWLALQDLARRQPLNRLPQALRESAEHQGMGWTWFHTHPHILLDVALPAWPRYLERFADLLLSAEATAAWLRGEKPKAGELAQRLTITEHGEWVLRLWNPKASNSPPDRWPAIRS